MDVRRIPMVGASLVVSGLLALLAAGPAGAASGCTLTAPATVRVGDPLNVAGKGFPASSDIDVALVVEGGSPDQFTVQSNATGDFQISLTPEEADAGKTTITANAGKVCSATVTLTVLGANDAAPTPTAAPAGSAGGAAGSRGTAPRTDTASGPSGPSGSSGGGLPIMWVLAALSLAIGAVGLIATRPARSR